MIYGYFNMQATETQTCVCGSLPITLYSLSGACAARCVATLTDIGLLCIDGIGDE